MSAKIDFENALYELEQTTATLGFVQTAFAEGESLIDNDESAATIYMLYVVEGKTYYTKSDSAYTVVAKPTKTNIATYYEKTVQGSRKINVLVACGQTCKTVPKISSIYFFAPGAHTEGDGYLYQNRQLSDTFVFPNGKDGKVDSVFVDVDPAEEIAE